MFRLLVFLVSCSSAMAVYNCIGQPAAIPSEWVTMDSDCVSGVVEQIEKELNASMAYLAMGAYFSIDTVNRPGFANLFLESASEEREHAIKLIEYLSMRGELTKNAFELITTPEVSRTTFVDGIDALREALKLETTVTESIRLLIKRCEEETSGNDYHFADYLITEYLTEQYKGQRDLAGKVSELGKMMQAHGALGEFMYDKKLLSNEV